MLCPAQIIVDECLHDFTSVIARCPGTEGVLVLRIRRKDGMVVCSVFFLSFLSFFICASSRPPLTL